MCLPMRSVCGLCVWSRGVCLYVYLCVELTSVKPVFGLSLDDHLQQTHRAISAVIEQSIVALLSPEYDALNEEVCCYTGLLRYSEGHTSPEYDALNEEVCWVTLHLTVSRLRAVTHLVSKLILLASKTIHNDNYQIIQILCDAKWRGW